MWGQPDVAEIERLVLATVPPEGSPTTWIAAQLGQPTATIDAAVVRLVQAGLAAATDHSVTLTQLGLLAAAGVRNALQPTTVGSRTTTTDLGEVAASIGTAWSAHVRQRATRSHPVRKAVFLVLLLPGLFALRRWAWPRS